MKIDERAFLEMLRTTAQGEQPILPKSRLANDYRRIIEAYEAAKAPATSQPVGCAFSLEDTILLAISEFEAEGANPEIDHLTIQETIALRIKPFLASAPVRESGDGWQTIVTAPDEAKELAHAVVDRWSPPASRYRLAFGQERIYAFFICKNGDDKPNYERTKWLEVPDALSEIEGGK